MTLGALPDAHILFAPSMAEATRLVGDDEQYQRDIKNMKGEAQRLHDQVESGKFKTSPDQCRLAETQVEDRRARFNRMFSGPKPEVKKFLTDHCGPF
jgi:hypothetical protein